MWATERQGPILSLLSCAYQGDKHTDASSNGSLKLTWLLWVSANKIIALYF